MQNNNSQNYVGTRKGHQIDQLQTKIHERLVSECSIADIGQAISNVEGDIARNLELSFQTARAEKFYQLVVVLMYDFYKDQAINDAQRMGEYEY